MSTKDKDAKEHAPEGRVYDQRLVERNIKKGAISRKDYEKHIKSLPDAKDKAANMGNLPARAEEDSD